ncbi:MAG: type II toxin-antitoxin system Phd/YefM family antitoxin [Verrucomicrobiota bacterium]
MSTELVQATIRELRTDFRSVKRKMEQHGEVLITDNGEPAYVLKPVAKKPKQRKPQPDYYARLVKQQPKSMTEAEAKAFWEEARGDR